MEIRQSGLVNVPGLLHAVKEKISSSPHADFLSVPLNYENIRVMNDHVQVNAGGISLAFQKLVFCEGYQIYRNPFFHGLPVIPVKGELLEVEIPGAGFRHIILDGGFILPLGGDRYLAGSNYERGIRDSSASANGKESVEGKLKKMLLGEFRIMNHRAGIRPTTPDRRPLLGVHPEMESLFVLNGMGTKGVLLSPYLGNLMARHLTEDYPIAPEVDLRRFYPWHTQPLGKVRENA